jgi:hypothetical protein
VLLLAQGFLARPDGWFGAQRLADTQPERTFAAGNTVGRTRVRIMDAGRLALAQKESSA